MLEEHLTYVADHKRLEQYRAALAQTLNPGDKVADLGCGTGILGLLCLQAFLPIDKAIPVREGDQIKATIMARPADHLLAWVVELPAAGQRFSHSTWQGMMLAPEDLIRAHPNHIPKLSREGSARMTVLKYCDGQRTAREIEQAVLHDHPQLLPSAQEISRLIARVLGRDTRA